MVWCALVGLLSLGGLAFFRFLRFMKKDNTLRDFLTNDDAAWENTKKTTTADSVSEDNEGITRWRACLQRYTLPDDVEVYVACALVATRLFHAACCTHVALNSPPPPPPPPRLCSRVATMKTQLDAMETAFTVLTNSSKRLAIAASTFCKEVDQFKNAYEAMGRLETAKELAQCVLCCGRYSLSCGLTVLPVVSCVVVPCGVMVCARMCVHLCVTCDPIASGAKLDRKRT